MDLLRRQVRDFLCSHRRTTSQIIFTSKKHIYRTVMKGKSLLATRKLNKTQIKTRPPKKTWLRPTKSCQTSFYKAIWLFQIVVIIWNKRPNPSVITSMRKHLRMQRLRLLITCQLLLLIRCPSGSCYPCHLTRWKNTESASSLYLKSQEQSLRRTDRRMSSPPSLFQVTPYPLNRSQAP